MKQAQRERQTKEKNKQGRGCRKKKEEMLNWKENRRGREGNQGKPELACSKTEPFLFLSISPKYSAVTSLVLLQLLIEWAEKAPYIFG